MVWRFSWCTLAALFLLLFVAAEALRAESTQIEAQKAHNATSRGISRFNARTIDQTTEDSASPSSTTKSSRDRNFQSRKTAHAVHQIASETNTSRAKPRLSRTTERSTNSKHSKPEPANIEAGNNPRGRSTGRASADTAKAEPTISRRSDTRFSPNDDDSKKIKSNRDATAKDRHGSRRTASRGETEKLDSTGPSVFTGAPDRSNFRTGRKIQTSVNSRELRKQIPASKRFESETGENPETTTVGRKRAEGRNAPGNKRLEKNKARSNRSRGNVKEVENTLNRKGHDLLSESESVRVDIPFTTTTLPSLTTLPTSTEGADRLRQTSRASNRRSDLKETSRANGKDSANRHRGRGGDLESSSSSPRGSRRGSSRFGESTTIETTEQTITTKSRNANARDRSKTEARSRSRTSQDTGNAFAGQESRRRTLDRNSSDRRSKIADAKPKASEQDIRRSRGRSRPEVSTTAVPVAVTTIPTSEASATEIVTGSTTEAEMMITTINPISITTTTTQPSTTASTISETSTRGRGRGRGNSQGRNAQKEDFFNHGLGFRGRKVSPEGTPTNANVPRRPNSHRNDTQHRGNPGWTLRRRPGHSSKSESTSQAPTPSREQANEIIPPSEQITSTEVITKIETSTSTLRRGPKKLKTNEENLTSGDASTKPPRRGQKIFEKSGPLKTTAESAENDNYPPEFIAKLTQLKTNNTKPPPPKSTLKTPPEAKKSSAALFAERSKMKLDLARRLVKPELNPEENDLETSTASSFVKSKIDEIPIKAAKIGDQQAAVRAELKKGAGNAAEATTRSLAAKKGRIISERMVTSISVEEGKLTDVEDITKAYVASTSAPTTVSTEGATETTVDSTRAKLFGVSSGEKHRDTSATPLSRTSRYLERLSSTTPKPRKSFSQSRGNKNHSGERREKTSSEENSFKKAKPTKTSFRPRYNKRVKQKSVDDQNEIEYQVTTTQRSIVTSRYARKKAELKSAEEKSTSSTDATSIERQTKRREFRPRTATYRRHSEVPTTLTEATTKAGVTGVAITPRSPRYHATLKSSTTPQPIIQEPQVSLQVSNETVQRSAGITDSSNGNSGNTNIFSPTRSSLVLDGNSTLLEQIRSTVAPLLSSLGNKSPIFAGAYSNVNNRNSAPRITPNGSPPRFSARYKGAELFVRKPSPYQPTVPSITSSSTTPTSLLENAGAVPPIDVSSPGEPRFLTFYHAVESANIKDEQLQVGSNASQPERVAQVDSNASTTTTPNGSNGDLGNPNNDTTSPATASTTTSPQTPSDSSVITNQSETTTLIPRAGGDAESASPLITTEAPPDSQNSPGSSTTVDMLLESTTQSPAPQDVDSRIGANSVTDASTVGSSAAQDFTSTVDSLITVTTNAPTTIMNLDSEITSNDLGDDTPAALSSTTMQSIETTSINLLDGTTPVAMTIKPEAANSFESPESNAIEDAEGRSTGGTGSPATSSDAPTTETVSASISDAPTTELPITSTFRNRLIDFAQDILSRLQGAVATTTVPTAGGFTTTVPPAPTEISNAIEDSRANTALESLSQLRDIGATTPASTSDPTELTTVRNNLADTGETTTVSSLNANQLDARILPGDITTQTSITSSRERNTQSAMNIDPTTIAPGGNAGDSGAGAETLGNASSLPLDAELTTVSTQYTTLGSDARTSNDTLLSELMTIAKTLFSEAMNETQQLLPVQTTTDTTGELTTETSPANNSPTLRGNEVDQAPVTTGSTPITEATTLVSGTSTEQVEITESSSIGASSESIDSTTESSSEKVENNVETSSEIIEDSIETSSESVDGSIDSTSESVEDSIESTSESVEDSIESTSESVEDSIESTSESVEGSVESSLESVGASMETSSESAETSSETSLANESTTPVDTSENEVESIMDSTTQSDNLSSEQRTTVEPRLGEGSAELSQSNENVTVDVVTPGVTTQSTTILPEVESEVESSQLPSTTTLANTETDTTATPLPTNSTESSREATSLELTTNTYDLQSRNYNTVATTETQTTPTPLTTETMADQTTELIDGTKQMQSVNSVNESTTMSVTSALMTEAPVLTSTNPSPEVTMPPVVTVPESILSRVNTATTPSPSSREMTTGASVNTITETELATTESIQASTVAVTTESSTGIIASVTNDTDTSTNQTIESVTGVAPDSLSSDVGTRQDSPPENTTPIITTVSPPMSTGNANSAEATETTTNQHPLTIATEPTVDVVSNPAATTTEATNTPSETTTTSSLPPTTPYLQNETPTVVARFQDATSATAQGTAGSANAPTEQPTDTSIPTTQQTLFAPETPETSTFFPTSPLPLFEPSPRSSLAPTITTGPTTMTETTTMTGSLAERISTTESSGMDVFTVTAVSVNTALPDTTLANADENLVSTEASANNTTTTVSTGSVDSTTIASRIDSQGSSMSTSPETNVTATTAGSMPETGATMPPMMSSTTTPSPMTESPTTPYLGRFGGSRITPAPRFSPSSTTKAPLRDYLIYGIYPNKTIVRKRPEDNLIDARNVDSPYVIFGIYPDGRLVRKFPNGTIIPDPPRSPVEVVFTLSTTTTTNRPLSRPYYNQANQGTYSQYQAPGYYSNPRPAADPMRNVPSPGNVDLGLTGNAIVGPNGGGPDSPGPLGSPASTGKMSDVLLNTGGGLSGNIASAIAGLLTPITSSGAPMRAATDSQGGRIVVDRERDEATRTKEAGGQRSSVYIGQDKFVNYWTNARPDSNPRVLSVNINSVASAVNEGPSSTSSPVPSFNNLLNNESGGQVTAPPGFPWRDSLDQILGITTNPPVITASVSSNTLDDSSESNLPNPPRPVNPFVEVFSPVPSTTAPPRLSSSTPVTAATTNIPTTTMAPASSSSSTVPATVTPVTSTPVPAQISSVAGNTPQPVMPDDLANRLLAGMQKQNPFGSTFDDLAFLNSLLQSQNLNPETTTAKSLSEVEQLLANKILSLALNNPSATRSSKAIQFAGASSNSFGEDKPRKTETSGPIVIDLFPSSTASAQTWQAAVTQPASQKLSESTLAPDRVTWKPVPSSSTASTKRETESSTSKTSVSQTPASIRVSTTTTRAPVIITSKPATTPRPRTTTSAPFSFGAGLWQALFGGNFFGQPPGTKSTKQNIKQPSATPRPVQITPKPVPTTQWPTKSPIIQPSTERVELTTLAPSTSTTQRIDISKIQVITPNSILSGGKGVAAASTISTTQQPFLNNPNPRLTEAPVSTTFSPEQDAKFLGALLRALQTTDTKGSSSKSAPRLSQDDELFLRAILSGQTTTTTSTTPPSQLSDAALLAALFKAQGIEPPMPASELWEQLQLASLGQSVTSAPSGNPTTTSTTRPSSATDRPTASTTKKSATPRPTSRPRPRTTTWTPSSTYPPPLFSSFSNYGTRGQSTSASDPGNNGLFGATRAFSQFLGAAISGAAQQLQSFVRNGTRIVNEVVG